MKIEQIEQIINANEHTLPHEVMAIGGFTSPNIRNLMNGLGKISTKYLEIGTLRGATFIAAVYGNNLQSVAIDNFSEFDDGTVENEFRSHLKEFSTNTLFIKHDCFQTEIDEKYKGLDLFLYDGAHDYESQKKAITHFLPWMADEFILCVDDYDWKDVQNGTQDGIKEVGLEVLFEKYLTGTSDQWWNGFMVALLKKKA